MTRLGRNTSPAPKSPVIEPDDEMEPDVESFDADEADDEVDEDDEDENDEDEEPFTSEFPEANQPSPVQPSSSPTAANRSQASAKVPIGMSRTAAAERQSHSKVLEQRRSIVQDSLLSIALQDQDEAFKNKVYQIVIQTGIDIDDPMFLVLAATGRLETLLEESPKELSALFDQWSELIHSQLDDYSKSLEHYERAAVKGQQKAIARSVSDLIRKTAFEKFVFSINALSLALGSVIILSALGLGGLLGSQYAKYQAAQTKYAAGIPQQLTVDEVLARQWAQSKDGKFAKQLMTWNADLLSLAGNQRACQVQAKELQVTLQMGDRMAQSGFCTLWVSPVDKRQFVKPEQ